MFYSLLLGYMVGGRKKKCRTITIDTDAMICHCFGPLKTTQSQLESLEQVTLGVDELQAFVSQDIECLSMVEGAKKMGVSKTVYVGMYQSAKKKVADCLINNKILLLECDASHITSKSTTR